jgi:micrococcal nuclease
MLIGMRHVVGGLLIALFLIGGAFAVGSKWHEMPEANTASAAETVEDAASTTEEEIQAPVEAPLYTVTRIVDGDTIVVHIDGKDESLRLIGVDTPEINDSRTGVQCFGKEASEYTKSILTGKKVRIEKDATQGERDKYKRLLAYVFREDGLSVNKSLVEEGFAHEYTYDTPYKYQSQFKAAEVRAREEERGLWAPDACPTPAPKAAPKSTSSSAAKQTASAAAATVPAPVPAQAAPQPMPQPQPVVMPPPAPKQADPAPSAPPPAAQSSVDISNYTCSANTYNCTDFKTQAEAQAAYDKCGGIANDIHKLDKNKDGHPCDSLP